MANLNAVVTPGYGFSTGKDRTETAQAPFLYPHHGLEIAQELISTAHALVNPKGVGIYATDETPEGIEARLIAAHGEQGETKSWTEQERRERRRRWRECLYESLPSGNSPI